MTMFQTIKGTLSKAAGAFRVRNPQRLSGPTLLRTYGTGTASHVFALRSPSSASGDLSTRSSKRM